MGRACIAVLAASFLAPTAVWSQVVDTNLWGMGLANVTATACLGNTLYVGGVFGQVGPNTGSGIPLEFGGGAPVANYAKVNGEILAVAADGSGGWFIGGSFTAVGGVPRSHLAHVLGNGEVGQWSPDPDREVTALARSGGTLYIGGKFSIISGQPRSLIAAFDVATGQANAWHPDATGRIDANPVVAAIAVRGDTVYVGGNFTAIGGRPRRCLAAVDARTGGALDWNPSPDYLVNAIALSGNTAYVGGEFTQLGGQPRYLAGAVDLTSGAATVWDPHITNHRREYFEAAPFVGTLLVHGESVFIGGLMDTIGGQFRPGAGAVDVRTGVVTSWDPKLAGVFPYPYVRALASHGDTIYVGGYFSTVQGTPRICLAALDAITAAPTGWDPRPNDEVDAIAVSDDHIYAGGSYQSLGTWQVRHNLAAFDLTTGRPTDWDPDPDGIVVYSLAAKDGVVFAGGAFSSVGGQARSGIAALDATSGVATTWNPTSDGAVTALMLCGDTIYAGGDFSRIGGQQRSGVAALDGSTGAATSWDPHPGDGSNVNALVLSGTRIYLGGSFISIGFERRVGLAAVDATTGAVSPWRADVNSWVEALALSDGKLYVAGRFDTLADQPRTSLGAVDIATGTLTQWNPNASGSTSPFPTYGPPRMHAIACLGHDVFFGGDFSLAGGKPRFGFAAVDDSVGLATDWDAGADAIVWSLNTMGSTLLVGGKFRTIGGLPTASLAAVSFPPAPIPPPSALALAESAPNPARTTAIIHFGLPAAGPVTLEIFDVLGRRVATLLDHQHYGSGGHDLLVRADRWESGTYFYRLEAGGRSATRKLVIVR